MKVLINVFFLFPFCSGGAEVNVHVCQVENHEIDVHLLPYGGANGQ